MADDSWYRNTEWNTAIALAFEQKLKRARDKSQYLRIQACTLARLHPRIALELLQQYFALANNFDHAQAYVDQATAYIALGEIGAAIHSYRAALAREQQFPSSLTMAYLDLPFLIATQGIAEQFDEALGILSLARTRIRFPIEHFKYHAAHAFILANSDHAAATIAAQAALQAAAVKHSGLQYHATVGLVTEEYAPILAQLRDICRGG
jgi:hypothetical protein